MSGIRRRIRIASARASRLRDPRNAASPSIRSAASIVFFYRADRSKVFHCRAADT
jgi:hypothetical protein